MQWIVRQGKDTFSLSSHVAHLARPFGTASDSGAANDMNSHGGRLAWVVPPSKSEEEAKAAFLQFQRSKWLTPSDLLGSESGHSIRAAYFPFWAFKVRASIQYSAKVAPEAVASASPSWRQSGAHTFPDVCTDYCSRTTQVYASYHDRRDLAEGLKAAISEAAPALQLARLPLTEDGVAKAVGRGAVPSGLQIQPVEMRQAIAWELALRELRHEYEAVATARLKAEYGAASVTDIDMRIQVHHRAARVYYVPGFVLTYAYGQHQQGSLEILQQTHQAIVPGAGSAAVIADRHFCPRKSQVATVAAIVGAAAVALVPFSGDAFAAVLTADTAFYAFLAASAAGVAARGFTGFVRDRHVGSIDARVEDFNSRYMKGGMSAVNMENIHDEWLRNNVEWMRWEETDKWDWQHDKRRAWAERLFQEHHRRRIVKRQTAKKWQEEEQRQRADAEREARREAKFGRSYRKVLFSGGEKAGGKLDYKGYYRLLGLDADDKASLSVADVKAAYRKAALKNHPDLASSQGAEVQKQARAKFQRVQRAYQVLKDPEKRKLYDAGAHVEVD